MCISRVTVYLTWRRYWYVHITGYCLFDMENGIQNTDKVIRLVTHSIVHMRLFTAAFIYLVNIY